MKKVNLAILGATGAVGREMLKVLEERDFPIGSLKLLARSGKGTVINFRGEDHVVQETTEKSFDGTDITLIAVGNSVSEYYMPFIKKSGSLAIDNSSAFRMQDDVPLIIPEVNRTCPMLP